MGVIICWVVFAACGVVAALYVYRFSKWVVRLVGSVGLPRPVLAALSVMAVVATLVSGKGPLLSLPPPTLIPDVVDVEQSDNDAPSVTDLRFTAITPSDHAVTLAFAWPESWTFTNGLLDLYGCSDLAAGDWQRLAQVDVSLAGSNAVVTLQHASFPVESMGRMAFFRLASQDDTDGDGLPDKFEDWCFRTDPNLADSENDGLDDGDEEALGTNPQENDTDGDGLTDIEEAGRISLAPSFEWHDTTGGATCWSTWDPEGGSSSGGWSWDAIEGWNGAYHMSWFPASRWIAGRECTFVTACEVGHVTVAGPGDLWWVYPEEVQSLESASNCGTILVAPYWSDLSLKYGDIDSFIRTAVDATDGSFVVEFHNVRKGLGSEQKMTFQVIVPSSGDEVRVSYLSSDVWMDGVGAVVGVQAGRTYLPERGYYNLTWDFARRGPILPQTTVVYRLGTGTDPLLADSDGDGLDDCCELETSFTNPFDDDMDGDGLTDLEEVILGTYPNRADSDQDGFPDGWEHEMGLDPLSGEGRDGRLGDYDEDGLTNEYECWRGTHPCMCDTDDDGLDDGDEITTYRTDPLNPDMDGDGLDDGDEIMLDCDPLEPDSDGDGMFDGWEFDFGFDPAVHNDLTERTDDDGDADPDGDGLDNLAECAAGTNPVGTDSNGDGLPDGWDSDGDGVSDGMELRQSSDPVDSRDGGVAGSRVPVQLRFGDHSGSSSEKYRLSVRPVSGPACDDEPTSYGIVNLDYGECETKTVLLKPGWLYEVRLSHAATKFASTGAVADYDYTLEFPAGWNLPACVVFDDPDGLFDVDETSTSFSGEGKVATFFVPVAPSASMAVATIGVNADDDDGDGRMDFTQNGRVVNDDDLVEVVVSAFCPEGVSGTASIELWSNSASLWKDRDRTEAVEVFDSFPVSGETSRTYYLEGDSASARHGVDALRASLSVGSVSSGTAERHFTVIDRRAEPITTARVDGCIVNPCGAVVGGDSHMQIGVLPTDYPDANIHWRVVSGQGTFVGGDTGRNVVFRASGQADETVVLQVDCGDCPGRSPQFTLRTCTLHEVKVYPCAIYSPGETTPITQAHVQELLDEVNVIYRQVGLHFSLGAPLVTRVNSRWDKYGLVDKRIGNRIRLELHDTGGIEVYFIKGFIADGDKDDAPEILGVNNDLGIIIKNDASANVLAHEIGHACGWSDVYADRPGLKIYEFESLGLKRSWLPQDWNNGTGGSFYNPILTHGKLIERLLMHGVDRGIHTDIPGGNVHGVSWDSNLGMINIGQSGVWTKTPRHL